MPKYWMINDRSNSGVGPDVSSEGLTYWVSDKLPLTDIKNWRRVTRANFQKLLIAAADKFPAFDAAENEKQSHVTILVHGYNQSFVKAANFYQDLCGKLFEGPESLGLCILYDWPSRGSLLGYEPDRSHARIARALSRQKVLLVCSSGHENRVLHVIRKVERRHESRKRPTRQHIGDPCFCARLFSSRSLMSAVRSIKNHQLRQQPLCPPSPLRA